MRGFALCLKGYEVHWLSFAVLEKLSGTIVS